MLSKVASHKQIRQIEDPKADTTSVVSNQKSDKKSSNNNAVDTPAHQSRDYAVDSQTNEPINEETFDDNYTDSSSSSPELMSLTEGRPVSRRIARHRR